jgi:lipopolysaccharide transport system permease protein
MIAGLRLLISHRRTLWATTLNDVRGRYAGTVMGIAWTVLYPLLFLGLYTLVFSMIFGVRIVGLTKTEQVLLVFAGLIPFFGLVEALGLGVGSVISNKTLIKNVVFPVELIPVKAVLVGSMSLLVSLSLLHVALWVGGTVHLSQLMTPIVFALQLLFTMGVIWPLSALNVLVRDLNHMVSVLVLFLMLASPIVYTAEMVPNGLRLLVYINPLYYLITLYRNCIVIGQVPVVHLAIFSLLAVGMFLVGHWIFVRFKEMLPDYV